MKNGSIALLLSFVLVSFISIPFAFADPPPEDVLRPEPDPSGYLFLQPHIGLNYSFLTSDRIRPLMPNLNESANQVVESGSGLGILLGIDVGYAWNKLLATRLGFQFDQRRFGNHGTSINVCNLFDDQGNVVQTRDEEVDMEYTVTGNYFTIGLMQDFRWSSFYATLGLGASFSLSADYSETDRITDTSSPCYYFPLTPDSTQQVSGSLFGDPLFEQQLTLKLGAGYIRELGESSELVIQVNYDHPLNNLFLEAETIALRNEAVEDSQAVTGLVDPEARFASFQVLVGVRFNLFEL